jgi:hypothetical protein
LAEDQHPIGEVFVELGFVTREEVDAALDFQRVTGSLIGEILVAQGKISRENLASALGEHWDMRLSVDSTKTTVAGTTTDATDGLSSETDADACLRAVGTMTALLASQITHVADELRKDIAALAARLAVIEGRRYSVTSPSAPLAAEWGGTEGS